MATLSFLIADQKDLQVMRGDTFTWPFRLRDLSGNLLTATGDTFKMQVRDKYGQLALELSSENGAITLEGFDTVIRIHAPASQMAELAPGIYQYDIERLQYTGDVRTVLRGRFIVIADVTN